MAARRQRSARDRLSGTSASARSIAPNTSTTCGNSGDPGPCAARCPHRLSQTGWPAERGPLAHGSSVWLNKERHDTLRVLGVSMVDSGRVYVVMAFTRGWRQAAVQHCNKEFATPGDRIFDDPVAPAEDRADGRF